MEKSLDMMVSGLLVKINESGKLIIKSEISKMKKSSLFNFFPTVLPVRFC